MSRLPNLYSVQFIPSIVSLFFLLLILYEVLEQGLTDPDNTRLVHLSQVCNSRSDWIRPLQPKKDPSRLPNLRSGQSVPVSPIFSALLDFVFFFFFFLSRAVMYSTGYVCLYVSLYVNITVLEHKSQHYRQCLLHPVYFVPSTGLTRTDL